MVRESTWLTTVKAILDGTLALIRPVITLTLGRWVARTRWMPAARAFWAILTTSDLNVSGRRHHQIGQFVDNDDDIGHSLFLFFKLVIVGNVALAAFGKSPQPSSISATDHFKALMHFSGSVITGVSRWGILLYGVSSTCLGSTRISFRSDGLFR